LFPPQQPDKGPNSSVSEIRQENGYLIVVGSGIKGIAHLTNEARHWITNSDIVLYCVSDVATERWIQTNSKFSESLHKWYDDNKLRRQSYREMTQRIMYFVDEGRKVCVVFYGHAGVFVASSYDAVNLARHKGVPAVLLPGISSDACMFADLLFDPSRTGCVSIEATDLLIRERSIDPTLSLIIWQAGCVGDAGYKSTGYDGRNIPVLIDYLKSVYGGEHRAIIYEAAQYAVCQPRIEVTTIDGLYNQKISGISTLFIPPRSRPDIDETMLRRLGLRRVPETGRYSESQQVRRKLTKKGSSPAIS
jgi:precorrin-6B methylase 1